MARRRKNLFGNKAESGKRLHRVLLWLCAVAAGVLVLGIVSWFQLLAYLQGESFRAALAEHLRHGCGAQELSLLSNLRIDGDRVEQEGLSLQGAGALSSVRVGHISLDVNRAALLNRRVHIRKISVDDGEVVLESAAPADNDNNVAAPKQTKNKQKGKRKAQTGAAAAPKPAEAPAKTSSFFRPKQQEVELIECKAADILLKRGEMGVQILNCALTSTPMKKGGWQHQMENGRLHTPFAFLRGASLKSATVTHDKERRDVTDCRIMLSPGEMRVRAHQDVNGGKWSANINLNKASAAPLLRGDWQKRVSGELFGKLTLAGNAAGLEAAEGYLSLQQGVLEGLPFLSALPYGGGYPYRHLELDKAECRISYPYADEARHINDAWLLDGINLRARGGLLRVHGHVIIGSDGALSGTLTIGIPSAVAEALPAGASLQRIFNAQGEAGYAWLNLNLSGTIDEPEEDLSVRCAALMRDVLPQAAGAAAATAEQMLRLLLNPQPAPAPTAPDATPAAPLQQAAEGVQQGVNNALKLLF